MHTYLHTYINTYIHTNKQTGVHLNKSTYIYKLIQNTYKRVLLTTLFLDTFLR